MKLWYLIVFVTPVVVVNTQTTFLCDFNDLSHTPNANRVLDIKIVSDLNVRSEVEILGCCKPDGKGLLFKESKFESRVKTQ